MDTLDIEDWWFHITMTRVQHEEFRIYSIKTIKKVFKCNTTKAMDIFNWFDLAFGLRIKN